MIANLHRSSTTTLYKVREQKAVKPSTYKERVLADRIVMGLMLLGTIVIAIISA